MPLVICNVELSEDFNSDFVITFTDPEDSTLFMPEILLIKFTISLYDFVVWLFYQRKLVLKGYGGDK